HVAERRGQGDQRQGAGGAVPGSSGKCDTAVPGGKQHWAERIQGRIRAVLQRHVGVCVGGAGRRRHQPAATAAGAPAAAGRVCPGKAPGCAAAVCQPNGRRRRVRCDGRPGPRAAPADGRYAKPLSIL
ncbi:hypothetical protein IWQ56_005683, partial [Coemansia nantahalensis]